MFLLSEILLFIILSWLFSTPICRSNSRCSTNWPWQPQQTLLHSTGKRIRQELRLYVGGHLFQCLWHLFPFPLSWVVCQVVDLEVGSNFLVSGRWSPIFYFFVLFLGSSPHILALNPYNRDYVICWTLSITWEIMEIGFLHMLPNFAGMCSCMVLLVMLLWGAPSPHPVTSVAFCCWHFLFGWLVYMQYCPVFLPSKSSRVYRVLWWLRPSTTFFFSPSLLLRFHPRL